MKTEVVRCETILHLQGRANAFFEAGMLGRSSFDSDVATIVTFWSALTLIKIKDGRRSRIFSRAVQGSDNLQQWVICVSLGVTINVQCKELY